MGIAELNSFYLVGGTALSLKYGHRISIDLDLFGGNEDFEREGIVNALINEFGQKFIYEGSISKWGLFCFIDGVKVDVVKYLHPKIESPEIIGNVRLYSIEDICAMKINAILGRGKKKDFWDIYEILHRYSLQEIINFHSRKFPNQMLLISIPQAISYFADAEESEDPISLNGQTWESVKRYIQEKVREYLQ
ncbi:nucleotidyl transferase AbiEii/AbiGii toxin family protein [Dyadobacter sp. CY345]|uniref:nucleotidyl transferase AbiEii/AbiGii toxin family protein n=1 Tax=Dyadobacter sp. CY345 TaxID=2909335 RepID=UPI001F3642AC|nr:nucleotidyl transferase AbiEii/AbiGii toxin family protein [Dyadobacter sp. CY345]MCF2447516.1 nucleotidyl transferase AbiEii/AbiGii toxin family protein [Dyadobacter sp. CY345]